MNTEFPTFLLFDFSIMGVELFVFSEMEMDLLYLSTCLLFYFSVWPGTFYFLCFYFPRRAAGLFYVSTLLIAKCVFLLLYFPTFRLLVVYTLLRHDSTIPFFGIGFANFPS